MKVTLFLSFWLSIISIFTLQNNEILVKGIVLDESDIPIIGANILVKGTTKGVLSDFDGRFELLVDEGETLVVSYIGYATKEVKVSSETLEIKLLQKTDIVDAIVVLEDFSKEKDGYLGKTPNTVNFMVNDEIAAAPAINFYEEEIAFENEGYNKPTENGFSNPQQSPYSTFALDVDRAAYSNIRRFIDNGQKPPIDAVRVEEMINYFDYNYSNSSKKHPIDLMPNYTHCPWNENHKLLHIAMKATDIAYDDLPASNLVFLIDVSGSMSDHNKLPLVVSSLKMLVKKLRPEDKIAIVTYAGNASVVLESTSAKEKEKIYKSLDLLQSGGSTAGAQGIQTAYTIAEKEFITDGNNRIILATDGDFNVGISSAEGLEQLVEKKRKTGIYLSVLGYGMGNYQDYKMQTLADKGNGNHAYIDNMQEAKKVLINEFGGTLFTVAKDVKIQIEFNPAYVQAYRLIGYENRMLAKEDFNNDKKDAGDVGAGHCVTAIYEIIPVGTQSQFALSVDDLKYQKNDKVVGSNNGELANIKCRYKHPDENKSIKFNKVVNNKTTSFNQLSDDVNFSISVAELGLIMSESQYIVSSDLEACKNRASQNKGEDKDGYRSEFIRLLETYELLD